jgi:hypothetical protein
MKQDFSDISIKLKELTKLVKILDRIGQQNTATTLGKGEADKKGDISELVKEIVQQSLEPGTEREPTKVSTKEPDTHPEPEEKKPLEVPKKDLRTEKMLVPLSADMDRLFKLGKELLS